MTSSNSVASHAPSPVHFRPPASADRTAYMQLNGNDIEYVPAQKTRSFGLRLVGWLQSSRAPAAAAKGQAQPGAVARPSGFWAWLNGRMNRAVAERFIQRLEADAPIRTAVVVAREIRSRAVSLPPQQFAKRLEGLAAHNYQATQQNLNALNALLGEMSTLAADPALHCPQQDRGDCARRAIASWRADLLAAARAAGSEATTLNDADVNFSAADVLPYLQAEARKLQDARVARTLQADPAGAAWARQSVERAAEGLRRAAHAINEQRFSLKATTDGERRAIVEDAARTLAADHPNGAPAIGRLTIALARLATEPNLERGLIDRAVANFADSRAGKALSQAQPGEHLAAMVDAILAAPKPARAHGSQAQSIDYAQYQPGSTFRLSAKGQPEIVPPPRTEVRERWLKDGLVKLDRNKAPVLNWAKLDLSPNRTKAQGADTVWVSPREQAKNFHANRAVVGFLRSYLDSAPSLVSEHRVTHHALLDRAAGLPPELFALVVVRMLDAQATLRFDPSALTRLANDEQLVQSFARHQVPPHVQATLVQEGLRKALQFEQDAFRAELNAGARAKPQAGTANAPVRLDDLRGPKFQAWRASFVEEAMFEYLAMLPAGGKN